MLDLRLRLDPTYVVARLAPAASNVLRQAGTLSYTF
jgi:hypothetical protein